MPFLCDTLPSSLLPHRLIQAATVCLPFSFIRLRLRLRLCLCRRRLSLPLQTRRPLFPETLFAMLIEITERVMTHFDKKDILIGGGVGCNDLLQEMMRVMHGERGGNLFATTDRYCVDNGAMIAYTGLLAFAHERVTPFEESVLLVLEV